MDNVKKIAILLLVVAVMTGFTQAATHHSKPDATLRVSGGSFALGIGVNWGSGTLTYKGKDYPVKVKGLSIGKVGMTSSSANGDVFNLKHLQDFNGHYNVGGAGWHPDVKSGRCDSPHFLHATGRCCQRHWGWRRHATQVIAG